MLYRRRGLSRISYERYFSQNAVFVGEQIELIERVGNRKLLPLPWLQIESSFEAGLQFTGQTDLQITEGETLQYHKSVFSLSPYTQVTRRHRVTCEKRGHYGLHTVTMTCGDLLGTQNRFTHVHPVGELIVYPEMVSLDNIPLPFHSLQGEVTVKRWLLPDPFTFAGTRDYQSGDALRQINWKATARAGRLQVHQQEYTADIRLMVCLNFEVSEEMWDMVTDRERIERGISYAASIAHDAILRGVETGFACNGQLPDDRVNAVRAHPESGQSHLLRLLDTMARLILRCSCSFHTLLAKEIEQNERALDYLLITSYMNDTLQERVNQLERQGSAVSVLLLAKVEERFAPC